MRLKHWVLLSLTMLASPFASEKIVNLHKRHVTGRLLRKQSVCPRGAYRHLFSIEGGYLYMERSKGSILPLVEAAGGPISPTTVTNACQNRPVGQTMLDTRQVVNKQHYKPGMYGAVSIYPSEIGTLELSAMGIFSWRGGRNVYCPQNLTLPTIGNSTYDYTYASRVNAEYRSQLKGAQALYLWHMLERYVTAFSFSVRAGANYYQIKETFNLAFQKEGLLVDLSSAIWDNSRYKIQTKAQIVAGCLGFDWEYNPYTTITCGIAAQGGLGTNWGRTWTRMNDLNGSFERLDYKANGSSFAYTFKGYPYVELRPSKHFSINVDYEFLYLGAVTVAERQFKLKDSVLVSNQAKLDNRGYFLCHGLNVRLKINF